MKFIYQEQKRAAAVADMALVPLDPTTRSVAPRRLQKDRKETTPPARGKEAEQGNVRVDENDLRVMEDEGGGAAMQGLKPERAQSKHDAL